MSIRTDGIYFKDEKGRSLLLRGVNLGGSTKVPYTPDGATHIPNGFFNHRDVSFVGRPFPLKEADEHFARLKSWGLTFLRFLVTWEAIEHAGPGEYDTDYLDYVEAIIDKAAEFGINVFIDPHEDVWSRFTGGDGAPVWTLEAVGFENDALARSAQVQYPAVILISRYSEHISFADPHPNVTGHQQIAAAIESAVIEYVQGHCPA